MTNAKVNRVPFSQVAASSAKTVARQLAAFAVALVCARGTVFGQYAPFGVAVVAAAPYPVLLSAALGAALGCLLPSAAAVPVHYLAAVLAAAAIRWTLQDLVRLRMHPVFAPLTAALPLLATMAAILAVNGSGFRGAVMYVSEAVLAGCAAYFFRRTAAAFESDRSAAGWSPQEVVCGAFSAGVALLGLSGLSVGGVSAGRILAVVAVLFAARFGGVAGGCVAGVATGLVFSLSTAGLSYLSGAYALGGLMAGLFSPLGRLAAAASFVVANGLASLQVGSGKEVVAGLYEVAAATVIYMLLPARAGGFLAGVFSRGADDGGRAEGLRRSVVMKLDCAAKALDSVSDSVEEVSRKLEKTCAPDINGVYEKVVAEVCHTCGLRTRCWQGEYGATMDAFNNLTQPLRVKGKVGRSDFSGQFLEKCSRLDAVADSVNGNYARYTAFDAAETRARQVRGAVAQQFSTAGEILEDLSSEMEMVGKFDDVSARKAEEILRLAGAQPTEVICRTDRFGRLSLEAVGKLEGSLRVERGRLFQELARACGRKFGPPCVNFSAGSYRLRMSELARYRAKLGCAQHVCGNGKLCGDNWKCFPDGNGRQIALISDGMGTGGRAAVDGAMACGIMQRLVEAGVGFDAALRVVNSALLAKSGDESMATMDIAVLDLYTGEAELLKAGAPETIFRRGGRAVPADMPGLPIGILDETRLAKSAETLSDGDLIVMVSDGALASGSDWLCALIEDWKGNIPQELAEEIVGQAISRRSDGHDDDVTALVLMLGSAVDGAA